MISSKCDVEHILLDMRTAIDVGKFYPINRTKNKNSLSQLGLLWQDVKEEIYQLTYDNYISGPDIDRNYPSTDKFWKFKKRIDEKVIYIKFKILYQDDRSVRLVSFHIDEP